MCRLRIPLGLVMLPGILLVCGLCTSPGHAQQSGDMHEIERKVETDEEKPKVQSCERLAIHLPGGFREPVVERGEDGKEDAADNHVMKMSHHVIGIS